MKLIDADLLRNDIYATICNACDYAPNRVGCDPACEAHKILKLIYLHQIGETNSGAKMDGGDT